MTLPTGRRLYVAIGVAALVLVAALNAMRDEEPASPQPRAPRTPPAAAATTGDQPMAVDDVKLELLKEQRGAPVDGNRNPFRFQPRQAAPSPRASRPASSAPAAVAPPVPTGPPPPPPIPLRYIGLMDAPTQSLRVAVLSDGRGNVFYGKEGDIIEGRYRVVRIGADAAELAHVDGRGARVRAIARAAGLDGVLVTRSAGKRWLAGFVLGAGEEPTSGWSGTLLVTDAAQLVLADARYTEQAEHECPGWEVRRTRGLIGEGLPPVAAEVGARRLGAEARAMSHAEWASLEAAGLELVPVDEELEALRLVKDADEIAAIERACALTDRCFAHLLDTVRPGMTEREVAWEVTGWFRVNGAEALAFEPLVLVGARAAMPHGKPSDTAVQAGRPLLIDFGCQVDGYRSDMTRTVFFGEPDAEARRRYEAVREAQQRAFEAVAVGVIGSEVHAVARRSLEGAGLSEAFTHGLGHGIGLETHEEPRLLTWHRPLEAGMVFSIEPGVYLPGEIGIRIEDDVVLEVSGPRRLTSSPRDLLVL